AKGETDYLWPIATPNGEVFVFAIWTGSLSSSQLATTTRKGDVIPLGLKGIRPLAVLGNLLVYVQDDGVVMAVRLDRSGRHAATRPAPVLDPVPVITGNHGNSDIFVSRGGALISSRGGTKSQMAYIELDGSPRPINRHVG